MDKEEFFKNLKNEMKRPSLNKVRSTNVTIPNTVQNKYAVKNQDMVFNEDDEEGHSDDSEKKPSLKVDHQDLQEDEEDESTKEAKNKNKLAIHTSFGSGEKVEAQNFSEHSEEEENKLSYNSVEQLANEEEEPVMADALN